MFLSSTRDARHAALAAERRELGLAGPLPVATLAMALLAGLVTTSALTTLIGLG